MALSRPARVYGGCPLIEAEQTYFAPANAVSSPRMFAIGRGRHVIRPAIR
jgi:hypothetical protein